MITLEITETQMHDLLLLTYLGEWMLQAHQSVDYAQDIEELQNKLLETAYNAGLDSDVEFDSKLGGHVHSSQLEKHCGDLIQQYDEQNFWEEFVMRMADKKFQDSKEDMTTKDYEKKLLNAIYEIEQECNANGLQNVIIKPQ